LSHIRYHSITRTLSLEVSTNTHIDCRPTLNISSIRFVCRPILIVPSVFLLDGCVCQLGIKENNDDDDDDDYTVWQDRTTQDLLTHKIGLLISHRIETEIVISVHA